MPKFSTYMRMYYMTAGNLMHLTSKTFLKSQKSGLFSTTESLWKTGPYIRPLE